MEGSDFLGGLRGLFQDLSALSSSSILNIERLRVELQAHIDDFKKLIDKPAKSNSSRQAVLSGAYNVSVGICWVVGQSGCLMQCANVASHSREGHHRRY